MPGIVETAAAVLRDRYGDRAFAVAASQAYAGGSDGHAELWNDIADRISELNRSSVAAILDLDAETSPK